MEAKTNLIKDPLTRITLKNPTVTENDLMDSQLEPTPHEKEHKELVIQLLRAEFDKGVLFNCLSKNNLKDGPDNGEPLKIVPNNHDIELNYNTKATYVNYLQDKYLELYEQIKDKDGEKSLIERQNLNNQIKELIAQQDISKKKYVRLKRKFKESKVDMEKYEKLILYARKMKSALRGYQDSGTIMEEILRDIEFTGNEVDLGDRSQEDAQNAQGKNVRDKMLELDEDVKRMFAMKDRKIMEMGTQIKQMQLRIQTYELNRAISAKQSQEEVEKRIEDMRQTYETEMQKLWSTTKEEISVLKRKILNAETTRIKEHTRFHELQKGFEKQRLEAEAAYQQKEYELKQTLLNLNTANEKCKLLSASYNKLDTENKALMSKYLLRGIKKMDVKQSVTYSKWKMFLENNREKLEELASKKSKFESEGNIIKEVSTDLRYAEEIAIKFNQMIEAKEEFYNKYIAASEELKAAKEKLLTLEHEKADIEMKIQMIDSIEGSYKATIQSLKIENNEALAKIAELQYRDIQHLKELGFKEQKISELNQQVQYLEGLVNAGREQIKGLGVAIEGLKQELDNERLERLMLSEQLQSLTGPEAVSEEKEENSLLVMVAKNDDPKLLKETIESLVQKERTAKLKIAFTERKLEKTMNLYQVSKDSNDKLLKDYLSASKELSEFKAGLQEEKERLKAKYEAQMASVADGEFVPASVLNTIKATISSHETKMMQLQKSFQDKNKQLEEKNGQLSTLQNTLSQYIEQSKEMSDELTDLRAFKDMMAGSTQSNDIVELKVEAYNLRTTVDEQKTKYRTLSEENESLRQKVQVHLKQREQLETEIEGLHQTITQLQSKAADLESNLKLIEEKSKQWESRKAEHQKEIILKQQTISKQSEEISSLKITIEGLKSKDPTAELTIRRLVREKERLIEAINAANQEVEKSNHTIKELEEKIKDNEAFLDELKKTEVFIIKERLLDQTQQILEMVNLSNQRQNKIEELMRELDHLAADNRQLKLQIEIRDKKLENLKFDSKIGDEKQSIYLNKGRKKYNMPEENINTTKELRTLYELLEDLEEKVKGFMDPDGNVPEKNPQMVKLKRNIADLSTQLNLKNDMVNTLNKRLERTSLELGKAQALIKIYEDKIDEKQEEIVRLNVRVGELTFSINRLNGSLDDLRKANSEHNAKLQELAFKNSDFESVVQDYELKINLYELDGKLYKEKISGLLDQIAKRDREIEQCKAEIYELQENLIANTEEFFEKVAMLKAEKEELEVKHQEVRNDGLQKAVLMEELTKKNLLADLDRKNAEENLKELRAQLEEAQRLSKLSPAFIQKINAYQADEAALEALQTENANLMARIILLENQINAELEEDPEIPQILPRHHFHTTLSDLARSEVPKNLNIYATTLDKRISKSKIDNLYEDRLHNLRKKMDMLELENQALIKNLNAYIEKARKESGANEPLRIKDFYTNNPQVMQNIKLELLNRSRKIESLHITINRMAEDYRVLKAEANQLEEKLSERDTQLRSIDNERIFLMEQNLQLRQKEKLGEIFKAENLSEANKKIFELLKEKEEHHQKVCAMYQSRINGLNKAVDKHELCEQSFKLYKADIKKLKEQIEKMESKVEASKAQVKDSTEVYESLQEVHKGLLREYHSLKDKYDSETKDLHSLKAQSSDFKEQVAKLEFANDQLSQDLKEKSSKLGEAEYMVNYLEKLIQSKPAQDEAIENAALIIEAKEEKIYRLQLLLKNYDNSRVAEFKLKRQAFEQGLIVSRLQSKIIDLEKDLDKLHVDHKRILQELDERTAEVVRLKESLKLSLERIKRSEKGLERMDRVNVNLKEQLELAIREHDDRNAEYQNIISAMQDDFAICFNRIKVLRE